PRRNAEATAGWRAAGKCHFAGAVPEAAENPDRLYAIQAILGHRGGVLTRCAQARPAAILREGWPRNSD
nr:hypothetical protein [Tanacetum cinerariifolium]